MRIIVITLAALSLAACSGTATTAPATTPPASAPASVAAPSPVAPSTAAPTESAIDPVCESAAEVAAALPDLTTAPLFEDMGTQYLADIEKAIALSKSSEATLAASTSPLAQDYSTALYSLGVQLPIYRSQLKDEMATGGLTSSDGRARLEDMGAQALQPLKDVLASCS